YADKDVINASSVMLSGVMMFEFMGWKEVGQMIEHGIARTIQQKRVTYDLERLMTGATKVSTTEFAASIIENMSAPAPVGR
ncbi:MAG: isocitrate/isopropylmalate family dehydrogenase, partial [Candidatus Acidiferrales bacterium]